MIIAVSWQFLINSISLTGSANNGTGNGTRSNSAAGALDATNTNKYDQLVKACLATGAHCVIDVHNYARFENKIIGQGGPTNEEFANLWGQIATKVGLLPLEWTSLTIPSTRTRPILSLVS